jgi:hypothetical protein
LHDDRFANSLNDSAFQLVSKAATMSLDDAYHLFKPNIDKLSCETVAKWAYNTITDDPEMDTRSFFKLAVEKLLKKNCKDWQPTIWGKVTSFSVSDPEYWRYDNRHFLAYVQILYTISPRIFDGKHSLVRKQIFARCITLLFPIFQERLEGQTTLPLMEIRNRHSRYYFFQSLEFFLQISGWQDGQTPSEGHRLLAEMSLSVATKFKRGLFNFVARYQFNHILSVHLSAGPSLSQPELVALFDESIHGAESFCLVLKRCNETFTLNDQINMLNLQRRYLMLIAIVNLYNKHKDRTTESPFPLNFSGKIFDLKAKYVVDVLRSAAFLFLNVPFSKSATYLNWFDQKESVDPRDLEYLLDFWLDGQASNRCTLTFN